MQQIFIYPVECISKSKAKSKLTQQKYTLSYENSFIIALWHKSIISFMVQESIDTSNLSTTYIT